MQSSQLSLQITVSDFQRMGINIPVGLDGSSNRFLPDWVEADPIKAIQQICTEHGPGIARINRSTFLETAHYVEALAVCAKYTDNPALTLKAGMEAAGIPIGEMRESLEAMAYLKDPKIGPHVIGANTAKQVCGIVNGTPEIRELLEQRILVDGSPSRVMTAPVSFDDLTDAPPRPSLAGKDLEARVRLVLDEARLDYMERKTWTIQKLCEEIAQPDFRVTTGISDPSGRWAQGFIIECKNRTSDRMPDADLFYSLYNVVKFYNLPTIVVLESDSERLWRSVKRFQDQHRKKGGKIEGNLEAVISFEKFRQFCITRIGGIA